MNHSNRLCIILTAICVIAALNFQSAAAQFSIHGEVAGLKDSTTLYLFVSKLDGYSKDSSLAKNGHFNFKGSVEDPCFAFINIGKSGGKLADILLDNREIWIKGSAPHYDSVILIGSELDKQWKEYYQKDIVYASIQNRLQKMLPNLLAMKDTVDYKVAEGLITKVIEQLRKPLLKEYVSKNASNAAGAVILTFCLLEKQLSKSEYLGFFALLSPAVQQSGLGKKIMLFSKEKQ